MSAAAEPSVNAPVDSQPAPRNTSGEKAARPPLRLWLPTLALLAYWVVAEVIFRIEMAMFHRFGSRMIALLSLLLFFLAWGFTRRHFTLKQRFGFFAFLLLAMIVAGLAADKTIGIFGMFLMGLPIVLTLATAWLWFTRKSSFRTEFVGIALATLAVFGVMTLLRWDGLDGRQRTDLSWRWTPTAEQQFLSNLESTSPATTSNFTFPAQLSENDWPSFRGGDRESIITGLALSDWSKTPPTELWRHRVGPAWSSVIAIGDFLITQEQRGDEEAVVCYSAIDGSEVWANTVANRFEEALSGAGPRATPSATDGKIVAYGGKGELTCIDSSNGQTLWQRNVLDEADAPIPQWGLSISPLIVDDLVVVFAGGKDEQGLLAYDLTTGEPRWSTPAGTMTYGSPQVMTIDGVRQIVMHDEQSLFAVDIETGKRFWQHISPNAGSFQPMIQPHLIGTNQLLVGWGTGILSLDLQNQGENWAIKERWSSNRLKPGFNDFVITEGYIYGLDDGILCCVSLEDGKRIWKAGRYGFGQMLFLADQQELLILTEKGDVVRVAATPEEHRELSSVKAIEGKTWNHPIIAHNRLIVRNGEEMACFDLSAQ